MMLKRENINVQINSSSTPKTVLSDLLSDYFDFFYKTLSPKPATVTHSSELNSFTAKQTRSSQQTVTHHSIEVEKLKLQNVTRMKRKLYNNRWLEDTEHFNHRLKRNVEHVMYTGYFDSILAILNLVKNVRLLVLSDDVTEVEPTTEALYNELLEATLSYFEAEYTRSQHASNSFFLYKSEVSNNRMTWKHVATMSTSSERSLNPYDEWASTVVIDLDGENELKLWSTTSNREEVQELNAVNGMEMAQLAGVLLCLACTITCALAVAAAYVRRVSKRQTPRRPRAVSVLAPTDFQFPADEHRRVGEGMETMLSWLQQFHEFGGPEPEKPDLLKRPEPLIQSAPSSTCSVTRLTADNRTRYKVWFWSNSFISDSEAFESNDDVLSTFRVIQFT